MSSRVLIMHSRALYSKGYELSSWVMDLSCGVMTGR